MSGRLVIVTLLAYVLRPAVTLVTARTELRHNASVTLVYLLFLAVLAAILVVFVPVIVNQAHRLSLESRSIRTQLEGGSFGPAALWDRDLPLDEWLKEFDTISSSVLEPDRVFRVLKAATSNVVWVLVILVAVYYLLREWEHLREWTIRLAPEAYQPDVRRLHQEIMDVWHACLRGQLLVMLTVGVLTGLASAVVGLPGAAALGLLAGALDLIPSVGPTAAMMVAIIVAWFEGLTRLSLSHGTSWQ